ncbi:MAG TPA: NAD-dependent malic enzyme 1, partial [Anaerolineae bacterium]|nr:NAD-dependent malic enzyme 1 [Anaerolineae bacterium]
ASELLELGGINLEDIKAPECFFVEQKLKDRVSIPVFHDDQHGTAVVSTAAIMTAINRVGVDILKVKIGQIGLGAAGNAIGKMLMGLTGDTVLGSDLSEDAVERFVRDGGVKSDLDEIMAKCDIVIATTGAPNLIKPDMIRKGQIIFALSNPNAEIDPEVALKHGAAFAADGKSVNNVLGFPGIFRGAMDSNAPRITHEMLTAAVDVLVKMTPAGELLPYALDKKVHLEVARAVAETAMKQGIARAEYVPYLNG